MVRNKYFYAIIKPNTRLTRSIKLELSRTVMDPYNIIFSLVNVVQSLTKLISLTESKKGCGGK